MIHLLLLALMLNIEDCTQERGVCLLRLTAHLKTYWLIPIKGGLQNFSNEGQHVEEIEGFILVGK